MIMPLVLCMKIAHFEDKALGESFLIYYAQFVSVCSSGSCLLILRVWSQLLVCISVHHQYNFLGRYSFFPSQVFLKCLLSVKHQLEARNQILNNKTDLITTFKKFTRSWKRQILNESNPTRNLHYHKLSCVFCKYDYIIFENSTPYIGSY